MRFTSLIALIAIPAVLAQGTPPALQGSITTQAGLEKLGSVNVAGDGAGNWYAVDPATNHYWTLDGAVKSTLAKTAPTPQVAPATKPTRDLESLPQPVVRHPRDFSPGTGVSPNTVGHLSARHWWLKCKSIGRPCSNCKGCKKDFWEGLCCWKKYFCFIPYRWAPTGPGWHPHRRDALPQDPTDGGPGSGPGAGGSTDGSTTPPPATGGDPGAAAGGGAPAPSPSPSPQAAPAPGAGPGSGGTAPPGTNPEGGPNPGPGGGQPAPGGGQPAPGGGAGGGVVGGGGVAPGPGPVAGGGCWNGVCDPYGWYYQQGTCQVW